MSFLSNKVNVIISNRKDPARGKPDGLSPKARFVRDRESALP